MAGLSEAPIKLKVVGFTRLSRPPRRKYLKTPLKLSTRHRRPNQAAHITNMGNQILQNISPPGVNTAQPAANLVSREVLKEKRHRMNFTEAKK